MTEYCTGCGGDCFVECEACHGEGELEDKDGPYVCPECEGTMEVLCYDCEGSGELQE